jgi:Mor family transcriptional regulator
MLLELRETEGWGYRRLAKRFDISKSQVRNIVKGQQRAQTVARYRRCT